MRKSNSIVPIYSIEYASKAGLVFITLEELSLVSEVLKLNEDIIQDITVPHLLPDCHLFYYIEEGELQVKIDVETVKLKGPTLFFVLPKQIRCVVAENGLRGWTFAIDSLLIDKDLRHVFEKEIITPQQLAPPAHISKHLTTLFQLLASLYKNKTASTAALRHLALCSVGIFADIYLRTGISTKSSDKRQVSITQDFFTLLRDNFRKYKAPSDYATLLNVSHNYLNECIKVITGMPIGYWINQEIILEAKRLLYYSNLTIKEIAYDLGYDDLAYFTRVFTKVTGYPPREFRKTRA